MLNMLRERADNFEKYLLRLQIRSDGNLSLRDIYMMPHQIRENYVESYNDYLKEKNKKSDDFKT